MLFIEGLFPLKHDTEKGRADMVKGCLIIKNQVPAPYSKSQRTLKWKTTGETGALASPLKKGRSSTWARARDSLFFFVTCDSGRAHLWAGYPPAGSLNRDTTRHVREEGGKPLGSGTLF